MTGTMDRQASVFLQDLQFEIVKRDFFAYKAVLMKTDFFGALEITHAGIQPYRNRKIPFMAYFFKSPENLVCPCISAVVGDNYILKHVVVFPYFSPYAHGCFSPI